MSAFISSLRVSLFLGQTILVSRRLNASTNSLKMARACYGWKIKVNEVKYTVNNNKVTLT